MKTLIFLLLLSVTQITFADWEKCNTNNADSNIQALTIKDKAIFAGTANSGILRSTDNGDSWEAVNKGMKFYSTGNFVLMDTLIFAATGSFGVFRSSDNGKSWEATKKDSALYSSLYIGQLTAYGSTLFGVYSGRVYRSFDKGDHWTILEKQFDSYFLKIVVNDGRLFVKTNREIYRSTDNGDNWTQISIGDSIVSAVDLLSCDSVLFVSISDSTQSAIYSSTDNGDNWVIVKSMSDTKDNYLLLENGGTIFAQNLKEAYRSTDKGKNWITITKYPLKIYSSRFTSIGSALFAASQNDLYKSIDNGLSWFLLYSGIYAQDITSLAAFDSILYMGTMDGIRRSVDTGKSWTDASIGMPDSFRYTIYAIAVKDSSIFVGTDILGVFRSTDNGDHWMSANKGLRKDNIYESIDIHAISVKDSIVYIRANYFNIASEDRRYYKSTNNGANWITAKINTVPSYTNKSETFAFGSLYLGIGHSTDNGDNWLEYKNTYNQIDTSVYTVFTTNTSAFAGTNGKGIYRSTDFGETWKQVNAGLTNLDIRSFAANDSIIFAGTEGGGVYSSTDNGNTWIPKIMKLMTSSVQSLTISDNTLFAGTRGEGVFRVKLTDVTTDVDESTIPNASFHLFPQPSNDYLQVRGMKENLQSNDNFIRIYNLLGVIVHCEPIAVMSQTHIDISSLNSGMYYLKIGAETKMFVKL